ncbi:MAG: Rv3654c family TadE-like protein [Actinomycetota bacterium]
MRQRGSVSIIVAASLLFMALFAALAADVARASAAVARAQTAADAAALAAAQELVVPSADHPADVAREYAEKHAARLIACECELGSDEVVVTVEVEITLPFVGGTRRVIRQARAVVGA